MKTIICGFFILLAVTASVLAQPARKPNVIFIARETGGMG